jgi:hypothetical protein
MLGCRGGCCNCNAEYDCNRKRDLCHGEYTLSLSLGCVCTKNFIRTD